MQSAVRRFQVGGFLSIVLFLNACAGATDGSGVSVVTTAGSQAEGQVDTVPADRPEGGDTVEVPDSRAPEATADTSGGRESTDRCEPSAALVDRVDPARLEDDLSFLVGMGERRTRDSQMAAAAYIRSELDGLGGVVVSEHGYSHGGESYVNIEATIVGTESPDEYLLIGAHFDSYSDHPTLAPGADDDASGIAALLEVGRALAGCTPKRTVRLVFFSNEEAGAVGSRAYAADLRTRIEPADLIGYINLDMVGYGPDDEDLDIAGRTADGPLVVAMAEATEAWTTLEVTTIIDDHCG